MSQTEEFGERYRRGEELVEEFLWRFGGGEDYRALACHAALPLLLPPALLKFLRHEFLPHLSWVAEVDLLLSKLCDEASEDVYVMKRAPRAYLIERMRRDPQLGEARIEAVNRILIESLGHLMRDNPGILPHEWRAQNWSAMLYVADRRDEAARSLADAIYRCVELGDAGRGEAGRDDSQAELARLTRLVREAATNLKDYPGLVRLAEMTGQIMADRSGRVIEGLRQSGQLAQTVTLPGVADEVSLESVTLLLSRRRGGVNATRKAASRLHQLPAPLPDFTGRREDLEALSKELDGAGVLIQGLGGIGKTAVAIQLAHLASERYPDAQLYLDLGGERQSPLTAAEAWAEVIRAWRPEDKLPDDEASLRDLYQSVLQDKRALLVLDNAADASQVQRLLPPPGSSLIVTSRRSFRLPELTYVRLFPMPPEEARLLLQRVAPRVGEMADQLAELCGYLPLALRVAAATLAKQKDLSVEEYVNRLTAARNDLRLSERVDWVRATVAVSYSTLTPERQRQWADLVVLAHDFKAESAAVIWETDAASASAALGELAAVGLLEFNGADDSYRMHEMLAEFARSRLGVGRLTEARSRHASHYFQALAEANEEYLRGGQSILSALARFDLEWPNIKAAQEWANETAERDEEAARLCVEFPLVGEHVLDLRRPPRETLLWLEQALDRTQKFGRAHVGHLLANLAHAYATLGDSERAVDFYEQALVYAREQGNGVAEGYILNNLGSNYLWLGDMERAEPLLRHALMMAREMGDERTVGQTLSNLGRVAVRRGDTSEALKLYEEHLHIARQIGDQRGEGQALGNIGIAYTESGEHQKAIEPLQRFLSIARKIGDRRGEGDALGTLARVYERAGLREEAIASAEASLKISEELQLPQSESLRNFLSSLRNPEPAAARKELNASIFYSLKDEELKDELVTHLMSAEWGVPVNFHVHPIKSTNNAQLDAKEIQTALFAMMETPVDLVLILVSAHFLASAVLSRFMAGWAQATKGALPRVVPIILSPTEWRRAWLESIQALPRDARPVTDWPNREEAYRDIAEGLKQIVAHSSTPRPDDSLLDDVEEVIRLLAEEYEDIRRRMTEGEERTRLMGEVVERMKEVAGAAVPLIPSLTESESPGRRLAAVVILKESPDPQYLDWLAGRLGDEKPFLGHQAARALHSAVVSLDTTYYGKLAEALNAAVKNLGPGHEGTDRLRTLTEAQKLLRHNWTNRYFNPPQRVREIGRPLTAGGYQELVGQLGGGECLVGLFFNQVDASVATHIQSSARQAEVERLYFPVEYYAVRIDAANELTDNPLPVETNRNSDEPAADAKGYSTEAEGGIASLAELVAALSELNALPKLAELETLLRYVEVGDEELRPYVKFRPGAYVRSRVLRNDYVELLVLCWKPGQYTSIRAHGASYGVIRVLKGRMHETIYAYDPELGLAEGASHTWGPGQVSATDIPDIRRIGNASDSGEDLVTLHCYSPPLDVIRTYQLGSAETDTLHPEDPQSVDIDSTREDSEL